MDMDMDIPEPDELEWLESNSCFPEEDLDLEPPDLYHPDIEEEEEEEDEQQRRPQPQSPQRNETQINGQKRLRPDGLDAADNDGTMPSEEKRSRSDSAAEECTEDWLRYSPPPQPEESVDAVVEEKIVSRYASEIDGDFIPVTSPSGGERVYTKICMAEEEKHSRKLDMRRQSIGLILEPINVLLQKVEQEAFTKALQDSTGGQSAAVLPEEPVVHKQLWVDKYAPNSFTDLLSDEQTNREVLLWLKQWDSCVYGSEIRSTSEDVFSALRRHSSIPQHQKVSDTNFARKNKGSRWHNENFRKFDNLGRENSSEKGIHDLWSKKSRLTGPPEQKILLLCGPPGLGKTTLAHVAAKHCGYRVVEVNASDDRSSSAMESKILDVVQMNSVTADSRPKCLVIDEIDGALGDGKGAVEVILKMVSADRKSDGKENVAREEQSARKSSKKGHKTASLSRPVICICNDLYAPALRPLRQVAKVHIFVQPTVSRVVSRLKYICNKEGMKASSIALTALAEYTECDIRSCLNTLQFLDKKKEILNVSEISSQVVGRKDMSRSVFDVWKEIFQKRKVKRERKSNSNGSSMSNDFEFLHSLIANRGDYDLIFDGIHENLLQLNYHDPLMKKTVGCLNSLGVSDLMHQYIMRTQQMPLLVYQPPIAINVHHLVSYVQKSNIEWPKSLQRCRTMLMDKMEVLRSWHYKILPYIGRHLSTKSFVEDSVSLLLHILSPPALRPVALHLLSEKEKEDFSQLVSTMVSYSVTYKNMKVDPLSGNPRHEAALDASTLCFDPPISEFINFKGYKAGHHILALAMKQVVVHEVEKQKILQVSIGKSQNLSDGHKLNQNLVGGIPEEQKRAVSCRTGHAAVSTQTKENARSILNPSASTIPSTSASSRSVTANVKPQSSGDVKIKKPSSGSINFFDRWKLGSKGSQGTNNAAPKAVTSERDSRPLLFKFNEGFTNAVKRPVRMREFLL